MRNRQNENEEVSLYLTLNTQDANLLRAAALGPAAVPRDRLGIPDTGSLAQLALGAICRAILRQGYIPRPALAQIGDRTPEALPENTITIKFPAL